jgi:hypothetical protein
VRSTARKAFALFAVAAGAGVMAVELFRLGSFEDGFWLAVGAGAVALGAWDFFAPAGPEGAG